MINRSTLVFSVFWLYSFNKCQYFITNNGISISAIALFVGVAIALLPIKAFEPALPGDRMIE